MTKSKSIIATLALSLVAITFSLAASDLQMGTWKLNEGKSKLMPEMGKNTLVVYATDGDKVKVTVDGVGKDGKATHSVWVGKFDGKMYPVEGNLAYNQVKYTPVDDHTNKIETMKDGKPVWSGKITVAKDGKSREVTVNGSDAEGKKFHALAVYDKE
ncbi:MAG: hypothetical protein ABI839_03055 [Verrucomicrobiota bacterium]